MKLRTNFLKRRHKPQKKKQMPPKEHSKYAEAAASHNPYPLNRQRKVCPALAIDHAYACKQYANAIQYYPGSGIRTTLTILDVVDSSQILLRRGSRWYGSFLDEFYEISAHYIHENGGAIDKLIGDAVQALSQEPDSGIIATQQIQSYLKARFNISIRAGLHTGTLYYTKYGELFGVNIHLAHRIAHSAAANQILVSNSTYMLTKHKPQYVFHKHHMKLKSFGVTPWQLYSVTRAKQDKTARFEPRLEGAAT